LLTSAQRRLLTSAQRRRLLTSGQRLLLLGIIEIILRLKPRHFDDDPECARGTRYVFFLNFNRFFSYARRVEMKNRKGRVN